MAVGLEPSSLSELSPPDESPARKLVCADLSLRNRRDRLLDIFPAEKSRFVDELDLRQVRVSARGTGSEQYPPSMLLSLLLFSDATVVFSSRRRRGVGSVLRI